MNRLVFAALALVCVCSPALAEVAITAPTTASLPWGDWLLAVLPAVSNVVVPIAAVAVTAGIAKVSPWAALFLSRARVQSAIQAGADYGINAVAGATKGKTITVPLGSAVIAAGVQHVVNTTPQRVIAKAGGAEGIASMIFRALPLDEHASIATVLQPAINDLTARGLIAPPPPPAR